MHDDPEAYDDLPRRRGRAARFDPPNRFEPLHLAPDPSALDADELRHVPTVYFHDASRSILSKNDSPDVPFTYSVNPYRGCSHGCIYCYARPSHEYLGFSAGLDFESKIVVKPEAPALLEAAFRKRSWTPQPVAFSGNTDCYQPVERRLALTRRCLEVCLRYRNPATVLTKNRLVLRDLDVLRELAALNLVAVMLSVTSLRPEVTAAMEPRTARPIARLKAIEQLAANGIPVGVMVAPIIPGLTDEEVPAILEAASNAGARWAGYQIVRLPGPVKDLFVDWIGDAFPNQAGKVLRRLAELRGPSLNTAGFGARMRGDGLWAKLIKDLFIGTATRLGLSFHGPKLATHHFRRPPQGQMELF